MLADHVAYIVPRFPKLSETFVLYEMEALRGRGVSVHVFPILPHSEPVHHPEVEGYRARTHSEPLISLAILRSQLYWLGHRPGRYLGTWWKVITGTLLAPRVAARALAVVPQAAHNARVMQRLGITHVHAHFANHPATAAWIVHRLTGIAYSFTAHAHDLYEDRHLLCQKVTDAAFTVAISDFNRRLIQNECNGHARVEVVHCGIDPRVFSGGRKRSGGRLRLICVGMLEPKKGHPYLIEACQLLKNDGLSLECVLIGDGPDRQKLEKLIRDRHLGDVVTIAGAQPRKVVVSSLAAADIAVLPSVRLASGKMEGIPVALMEAMASRLPVVATRISGIPELIDDGESGLLVPERDARALAQAILSIAEMPDRGLGMGLRGRARIERDFDLSAAAEHLVSLMRSTQGGAG